MDGRWIRVLTVVDQYTRECLTVLADTAIRGEKVATELRRAKSITVENRYTESFTGRLRHECLNVKVFFTLADARRKLSLWRQFSRDLHDTARPMVSNRFCRLSKLDLNQLAVYVCTHSSSLQTTICR
jgi:putative transposase